MKSELLRAVELFPVSGMRGRCHFLPRNADTFLASMLSEENNGLGRCYCKWHSPWWCSFPIVLMCQLRSIIFAIMQLRLSGQFQLTLP